MTEAILPCPFCGGEAHIVQGINGYTQQNNDWKWGVACDDCYGQVEQEYLTEAEAIAAWNTRAERTCHDTWDCELTGRLRFQCSECGAVSLEFTPRFCPCCGAKVVD